MSQDDLTRFRALRRKQDERAEETHRNPGTPQLPDAPKSISPNGHTPAQPSSNGNGTGGGNGNGGSSAGLGLPFDPLRLLLPLMRKWWWLPLGGLLLALPAAVFGLIRFKTEYTALVQLIRREAPTSFRAAEVGEPFKPRQATSATITSVMRSSKLLAHVASLAQPKTTSTALGRVLTITPEKNTDLITITLSGRTSAKNTVDLLNLYANEVVTLTKQMQAQEAAEFDRFLGEQLTRTESELAEVNRDLLTFSRESSFYSAEKEVEAYLRELGDVEFKIETGKADLQAVEFRLAGVQRELRQQNPEASKLNLLRENLAALRALYTESNPLVAEAREKLEGLEREALQRAARLSNDFSSFQFSNNSIANSLFLDRINLSAQREGLEGQLKQLEAFRTRVKEKLASIPEKSQRFATIKSRQQSLEFARSLLAGRQREAKLFAENSPGIYRVFAPATESSAVVSGRLKKLLLATLAAFALGLALTGIGLCGSELLDMRIRSGSDLRRLTRAPVLGKLGDHSNQTPPDEARWRFGIWAKALRELRLAHSDTIILGFASAQSREGKSRWLHVFAEAARDRGLAVACITNTTAEASTTHQITLPAALAQPDLVRSHVLEHPNERLHIAFDSSWKWNRESRELLRVALRTWSNIRCLVLLIELPPMEDLDCVLAAGSIPRILWVSESGRSEQRDLGLVLETMRAGDVNIVGSLLNREPKSLAALPDLSRFGLSLLLVGSLLHGLAPTVAFATEPQALATANSNSNSNSNSPPPTSQPSSPPALLLGAPDLPLLAPWQQRLTIGPGDVLHIQIYGRKDLNRSDITVGPDGRISYLEARGVMASGLTIDELRAGLDQELSQHYRNARSIITPVAWRSKKYYILGTVTDKGAFFLDRPLTIIEAVSRARGIATGLYAQNTVELADMERAFIVRNGTRLSVDFQKLFQEGDLSQNVLLEPGDYLYFPSGTVNEVYLLGAVSSPGPLGLTGKTSVMGVITVRGGFLPSAYKKRVLVIRGAMQSPKTFVIDASAILSGREKDFLLEPKDIVYVAERRWLRAEELLQVALNSFAQAMTATWVGNNLDPLIKTPLLPTLK